MFNHFADELILIVGFLWGGDAGKIEEGIDDEDGGNTLVTVGLPLVIKLIRLIIHSEICI